MKFLFVHGSIRQVVGHTRVLGSPHGYAAQSAKDWTERPEELLLLHEESALDAFGTRIELTYYKVPIGGVRGKADDIFVGMRLRDVYLPSHTLI